jgi:hypothetical protein
MPSQKPPRGRYEHLNSPPPNPHRGAMVGNDRGGRDFRDEPRFVDREPPFRGGGGPSRYDMPQREEAQREVALREEEEEEFQIKEKILDEDPLPTQTIAFKKRRKK